MPDGTPGSTAAAAHASQSAATLCPSCGHALEERRSETHGVVWTCPACGGAAIGVGLLKQLRDPRLVTQAWLTAESMPSGLGRPCPMCGRRMRSVTLPTLPHLEICTLCGIVWFDRQAFEAFPAAGVQPHGAIPPTGDWAAATDAALPVEARAVLAAERAKAVAEHARQQTGNDPPDTWWKYVAALFGMPVRDGEDQLDRPPWTTWGLVAVTCAVSLAAMTNLTHWIAAFGFIPAQAQRYGGLTFLTSFFLHAGLFHLVSNMYFLLLFGDNVEGTIGVPRYLLLIFMSAVVGTALHGTFDPHRTVPLVGASGGIAGIMAFYACQFPGVRLKFIFGSLWLGLYRWVTVPTWGFFAFWIAMQGVGVVTQVSGLSNVSSLGHMGGAAIGALFYLEWRFLAQGPAAQNTAKTQVSPR
jgi:membrane associated rhomboid family serine protease/Zn-finger nucleic acid-binding protein